MRRAVLALLLLGLGLGLAPAHAAEDYCANGHATAILFVDRTTRFDATDRAVFLDATAGLINALGPGDRLLAFTMTGAFTESRKIFDQCKPGCPATGFLSGLMATCSPMVARAALRGFTTDLATVLAEMLKQPEETPQSDLFRTIAEVTRDYATPAEASRPIRSVILFSDLIENSALIPERALKREPAAATEKKLAEAGLVAHVDGATVRVFGFGRDDAPGRPPLPQDQLQRVSQVWQDWFRQGGAADVEIGFR
jgi:hypothetical protein